MFSKTTDVDLPFKLCKAAPLEDVSCSDITTLSEAGLGIPCILVVQPIDGDILNILMDQKDAVVSYESNGVVCSGICYFKANDGIREDTQAVEVIEMGKLIFQYCNFSVYCVYLSVDAKRLEYTQTICTTKPILPHIIRSNIFIDVMDLFQNSEALKEFPLRIHFQDEIAFDSGRVCRDMFSGFWEEAYFKLFDGSSLLTPVLHATIDMTKLPLLGKFLSHGFLVCGYLPIHVTFSSLAAIL